MKKVLILSVTAGNGHNACARSMKNKLEELAGEEVEVKIVDTLKTYSTPLNFWIADGGYNLAVSKLLPIFNFFYDHYRKLSPDKRWKGGAQAVAKSCVGGLLKEILSFRPDAIYCTHFYPAIALTDLKLVYKLPCKIVTSNLDYVNSPYWESAIGSDYFIIPNEDFIDEFLAEGFKREQLLPLGLPSDGRCLAKFDKSKEREKIGLKDDIFTIMIMFGGGCWKGGIKIFKNVIDGLGERQAQVIMINGKNQKDFDTIEKMTFPDNIKVVNVGFTKEVPTYLACADVVVSKLGGSGATEILNVGRPMLVTEKVPGQEKCNIVYLKGKGVALSFKNKKQLKENLIKLYDDEKLREEMASRTIPLRKNACEDVAKLMLSFDNADYTDLYNSQRDILDGDVSCKDKICKAIQKKVKKAVKEENDKAMRARKHEK